MYGSQANCDDDQKLLVAYERWNGQVKQTVPAEQLLVYDVRQRWEPLGKVLKVPIPNEPFPCIDERKVMLALKNKVCRLLGQYFNILLSLLLALRPAMHFSGNGFHFY
ncbi:hypothetical protein CRM22_008634 [Opisthorchis felineus]|uniref:Uncharacterized protein n=1 Tax=Opisthorchis felineus TaxID=147828 RepID=A0A4S2LAW4_OPIFE|nr:hypothetical protein CRM22_008634 [Opisthorchis felineus]